MSQKYKFITFLFFAIVVVSFNSCGKKWKKPTDLDIKFSCEQNNANINEVGTGETFIQDVTISISEIKFDGERKQGDKYIEFTQKKSIEINYDGNTNTTSSPILENEVPQGTYNKIDITVTTVSVVFSGFVKKENQVITPINFSYTASKAHVIRAKDKDGSEEIILIEDSPRDINIKFNFSSWLSNVPSETWQNAQISGGGQSQPSITIDESNNSDIYLSIVNNLNAGIDVIFE